MSIAKRIVVALLGLAVVSPAFADGITFPSNSGGLQAANNLSDVSSAATSLTNIGGIGAATTNTLTNKTISGGSNTISAIANASLTNSAVTIGSTSVSLGATVTTFNGLAALASSSGSGYRLDSAASSATSPTVIPNRASTTTGLGGVSGKATVIVAGVAQTTWDGTGTFALGTIPTVTGTGAPTITTGSTDTAGEVTSGASATSVVITFSATKTNAPFCVVSPQSVLLSFSYTISTSAITITQTATSGEKIDYMCFQH